MALAAELLLDTAAVAALLWLLHAPSTWRHDYVTVPRHRLRRARPTNEINFLHPLLEEGDCGLEGRGAKFDRK